jgi:hypothetical protein
VVKDEDGLHHVGDSVDAAAELSQEAPALECGHGLLADAADLGVSGVVTALPSLEAAASKRYADGSAGALIRLIGVVGWPLGQSWQVPGEKPYLNRSWNVRVEQVSRRGDLPVVRA